MPCDFYCMGDCVSKSGHIMVRTLRPIKCRREGRFSERTHRKMAIISLYSVILSSRGCSIYERHVRRSEVVRARSRQEGSLGCHRLRRPPSGRECFLDPDKERTVSRAVAGLTEAGVSTGITCVTIGTRFDCDTPAEGDHAPMRAYRCFR